jgi:hypothetical protein
MTNAVCAKTCCPKFATCNSSNQCVCPLPGQTACPPSSSNPFGVCAMANGGSCIVGSDCCSGNCCNGTCIPTSHCCSDADCAGGQKCCRSGVCGQCCSSSDCTGTVCNGNYSCGGSSCVASGPSCSTNADCCAGSVCQSGSCCVGPGYGPGPGCPSPSAFCSTCCSGACSTIDCICS